MGGYITVNKIRDNIETIIYNNYGFYPDKYLDMDSIALRKLELLSIGEKVTLNSVDLSSLDILIDEDYSDSTDYVDTIYAQLKGIIYEYKWDKFKYRFNQAYKIKEDTMALLCMVTTRIDSKTAKDLIETGNAEPLATLV